MGGRGRPYSVSWGGRGWLGRWAGWLAAAGGGRGGERRAVSSALFRLVDDIVRSRLLHPPHLLLVLLENLLPPRLQLELELDLLLLRLRSQLRHALRALPHHAVDLLSLLPVARGQLAAVRDPGCLLRSLRSLLRRHLRLHLLGLLLVLLAHSLLPGAVALHLLTRLLLQRRAVLAMLLLRHRALVAEVLDLVPHLLALVAVLLADEPPVELGSGDRGVAPVSGRCDHLIQLGELRRLVHGRRGRGGAELAVMGNLTEKSSQNGSKSNFSTLIYLLNTYGLHAMPRGRRPSIRQTQETAVTLRFGAHKFGCISREDMAAADFALLGLPVGADAEAARTAFRRLALKHHPDKNHGNPEAAATYVAIAAAYERIARSAGAGAEVDELLRDPLADLFGSPNWARGFADGTLEPNAAFEKARRRAASELPAGSDLVEALAAEYGLSGMGEAELSALLRDGMGGRPGVDMLDADGARGPADGARPEAHPDANQVSYADNPIKEFFDAMGEEERGPMLALFEKTFPAFLAASLEEDSLHAENILFEKALETDALPSVARARAAAGDGSSPGAARAPTQAPRSPPRLDAKKEAEAELHNSDGVTAFSEGRYAAAAAHLSAAIALDPSNPALYGNRSLAREKAGDYEDALVDAESCLACDPMCATNIPTYHAQPYVPPAPARCFLLALIATVLTSPHLPRLAASGMRRGTRGALGRWPGWDVTRRRRRRRGEELLCSTATGGAGLVQKRTRNWPVSGSSSRRWRARRRRRRRRRGWLS